MNDDNKNWLTSTVYSLCNEMRTTKDFSTLPMLGDALLDADCTDTQLIEACMNREISPIEANRVVCKILGGELAEAVRWIEEFAADMSPEETNRDRWRGVDFQNRELVERIRKEAQYLQPDYAFVIEACNLFAEHGDTTTQHGGMDWQDMSDEATERLYECYELITDVPVPYKNESPFSCSC